MDFTKYCQQMHQGNGGGLGGTTATHNSIEYSNESYDAKTRTVTMHAVIDWSDPYRFGKSSALIPRSGDSLLPDNYRRAMKHARAHQCYGYDDAATMRRHTRMT